MGEDLGCLFASDLVRQLETDGGIVQNRISYCSVDDVFDRQRCVELMPCQALTVVGSGRD